MRTTAMTVMGNLWKKGWLRRHDEGRTYRYEPWFPRTSTAQRSCISTDRPSVLMHFLGELSTEETSALDEAYLRLTRQPSTGVLTRHLG